MAISLRDRSSLLLLHKIHSGAVSIEKDKYLTSAHSLKSTRSSCEFPVICYMFILVQSFTLFVGKIALMANV